MTLETMLALIGATAILVAIPGPNLALFIANTLAHGYRSGAVTVFGTATGIAVQLSLVLLGLAALLAVAASALVWLKWAGVAYLLYLGVMSWRRADDAISAPETVSASKRRLFFQGLMLSIVNPKTLLFNVAFIPQFVRVENGVGGLLVPALVYLTVILIGDLLWVAFAGSARPTVLKLGKLRHKLTGGLFVASGVGLALARVDR
ncbi:LysE family translocator [Ahrensia marina]|uniref:LysE family translocator n=1 Tax=Ahrensia marina TaxID=1514904 RepID=UPI0035D0F962